MDSRQIEPGHIGGLLLARALARQGAADLRPTAADAKASISYLLEASALRRSRWRVPPE